MQWRSCTTNVLAKLRSRRDGNGSSGPCETTRRWRSFSNRRMGIMRSRCAKAVRERGGAGDGDVRLRGPEARRIVAATEHDNLASIGVMRRLGMRIERNPDPEPHWFQTVGVLFNPKSVHM